MYQFDLRRLLLLLFCALCVRARVIFKNWNTESVQCRDICSDSFFLLPIVEDSQSLCQRGCRFFSLIYAKGEHDFNITQSECYLSCQEAYGDYGDAKETCIIGCDSMLKLKLMDDIAYKLMFLKQNNLASTLESLSHHNAKSFIFMDSERELLDSDLLLDPLIKKQIENNYNLEYKIPESVIRTMPIEAIIEEQIIERQQQSTGNWLDCASKNSGIPKWILLAAILIAVLVALWLSVSSEKKEEKADELKYLCQNGLDDLIPKKDPDLSSNIEKCELVNPNEKEVHFSMPPKYAVETEKV